MFQQRVWYSKDFVTWQWHWRMESVTSHLRDKVPGRSVNFVWLQTVLVRTLCSNERWRMLWEKTLSKEEGLKYLAAQTRIDWSRRTERVQFIKCQDSNASWLCIYVPGYQTWILKVVWPCKLLLIVIVFFFYFFFADLFLVVFLFLVVAVHIVHMFCTVAVYWREHVQNNIGS